MAKAPVSDSYFVMSGGSDRNNGLTEQTPFRSLFKAIAMAAGSPIKTITVMGTLDVNTEQSTNAERVFFIYGDKKDTILIRGKATDTEQAVLSAAGSGRRAVLIRGQVHIRFEDIEISGGTSSGEGGGIGIGPSSTVTLGSGAVLRNNRSENIGGGAVVAPGGTLHLEGGRILDNYSAAVGGGAAIMGSNSSFVMKDGEIGNNHAQGGGGIAVYQGSTFTMAGGTIHDNVADLAGGGVLVNQSAAFTMEGGIIRGNRSSGSGGGAALLERGAFVLKDGEINGNRAAEHGGGIAADDVSTINVQGGFISANRAASQGGGIFTAGSFVKSGGKIYGDDVPEDEANAAPEGAAVFIYRGENINKSREKSAGDGLTLDAASDDGWIIEDSLSE
jgi:predicted outer membrane repeat protein